MNHTSALAHPHSRLSNQARGRAGTGFPSKVALAGLLVFAGYYLGAKIGFALTFHPHPVSVLWPPNSILLAALLLTRKRTWWILLLAAFSAYWLVQVQSDVPPRMIFCWFVSNSCEALIGACCVRYFILPRETSKSFWACIRVGTAKILRIFGRVPPGIFP